MSAVRSLAGYRAAETRRERDEFATANIPDDLLPLWEKVKLNFRGTPEQRAEKFIQYAHDHEDDSIEAVSSAADRKLEAMIREHEARDRRGGSRGAASPATLLWVLGLGALGYVAYRAWKKKTASPPPAHHAGAWPPAPAQYGWE